MPTNRKGFLKLLDRYLKNKVSDHERNLMDIWYDSIQREPAEGKPLVTDNQVKAQMWNDIRAGMHRDDRASADAQKRRWWQGRYYQVAAASVVILLGFIFYRSFKRTDTVIEGVPDSEIVRMTRTSNSSASAKEVLLSDGSHITLEPGATLYYPGEFEPKKRVVYLKGNGFFDIAKDAERPFLVYTDDILTKVLGTSFRIERDHKRGIVEVSVATGKVLVEKMTNQDTGKSLSTSTGVVLTPNRKVIYYTETERYIVGLIEKPQIIEKDDEYRRPEAFVFSGTPLSVVLAKLEKAYGVQISVSSEGVKDCIITADLSQDDLYGKLEIICAAVNAKFELKEDKIYMTGQGCTAN